MRVYGRCVRECIQAICTISNMAQMATAEHLCK